MIMEQEKTEQVEELLNNTKGNVGYAVGRSML